MCQNNSVCHCVSVCVHQCVLTCVFLSLQALFEAAVPRLVLRPVSAQKGRRLSLFLSPLAVFGLSFSGCSGLFSLPLPPSGLGAFGLVCSERAGGLVSGWRVSLLVGGADLLLV